MTQHQLDGYVPAFELHDRLGKALEHANLGVQEFADKMGVSRTSISNYINGRVAPKRMTLLAWAGLTGVSLQWLETGVAPQPKPEGDGTGYAIRDSNPEPADLKHLRPDLRGVRLIAA